MKRLISTAAIASVAIIMPVAAVSAQDTDDNYPPTTPASTTTTLPDRDLNVSGIQPICEPGVPPVISYQIIPIGFSSTGPAEITIDPVPSGGVSQTETVSQLSGILQWPGSDPTTDPPEWPGWTVDSDGDYVPNPNDPNGGPLAISVELDGLTAAAEIALPSSPNCSPQGISPDDGGNGGGGNLPGTGSNGTTTALQIAAIVLIAGLLALVASRRRAAARTA